jgi:predicted GTPase
VLNNISSFVENYFLLYHGKDMSLNHDTNSVDLYIHEDFIDIITIILSIKKDSFNKYFSLEIFENIIEKILHKKIYTLNEIYTTQINILNYLQNNTKDYELERLVNAFKYLNNENVLSNHDTNKLISIFNVSQTNQQDIYKFNTLNKIDSKKKFIIIQNKLLDLMNKIDTLSKNDTLNNQLQKVKQYLLDNQFSIAITGVMNSGKSTLLNALMGEELLGTSVIPETANLSIIKYGNNHAQVQYWDKTQWSKIEKSRNKFPAIEKFVQQTKEHFKNNFHDYIKEKPLIENINIKDTKNYTSAVSSNQKCNLIQSITIYKDLDFLKDSIQIVDTPGLDDPVIQREEITKEYLKKSDLMFHLMNVSQSATQKDIDFIIDTLLYANITKLLIVITRIDMVTSNQLNEVIIYTKQSIKKQLELQNKENQLDYILESIEFIPVSAKIALICKTNPKHAKDNNLTLELSGIKKLYEYIDKSLYGSQSNKSELLIQNVQKKLIQHINKIISFFHYELELFNKNEEQLKKQLSLFESEKIINKEKHHIIREEISFYQTQMREYLHSLERFVHNEINDLRNNLYYKISSDIKYTYTVKKEPLDLNTITIMINTTIKDAIVDITRDYIYKFIKKSQNISDIIEIKYSQSNLKVQSTSMNISDVFQNDLNIDLISYNSDYLISQIKKVLHSSQKNNLSSSFKELEHIINQEMINLNDIFIDKIQGVNTDLIKIFFKTLEYPLIQLEEKIYFDEDNLKKHINDFKNNVHNKEELSIQISKNLQQLQSYKKALL